MNVYTLDPLTDRRWPEFIDRHDDASIFHTPEWLEALRRAYGYKPLVYTTSCPSSPLTNGIVVCDVRSWLTGRRLVSVPFADHCQPLIDTPEAGTAIVGELLRSVNRERCKYVELRPTRGEGSTTTALGAAASFWFHRLDLQRPAEELFRALHKDSIQRKIRRAEREGLAVESGRSDSLVRAFYELQVMTRRRHGLPPQPLSWFRMLVACLGERITVSIATTGTRPIAGLVVLRHRDTIVYKYGASDARQHQLGAMPFLFWEVIREGRQAGFRQLDLGRSDTDNDGLVIFKDRLGAVRSRMTYARYPAPVEARGTLLGRLPGASVVLAHLPSSLLVTTGRLLYKHIG